MAGNVKGSKMLSFIGQHFYIASVAGSDAHRTCLQDWPGSGRHPQRRRSVLLVDIMAVVPTLWADWPLVPFRCSWAS